MASTETIVKVEGLAIDFLAPLLLADLRLVPQRRHREAVLKGDVPSPLAVPSGCRFHRRCEMAQEICRTVAPPVKTFGQDHESACHFADEVVAAWRSTGGSPA